MDSTRGLGICCPIHDARWMSDPQGVFHQPKHDHGEEQRKRHVPSRCYRMALQWTEAAMNKWIFDNRKDVRGSTRQKAEKMLARIVLHMDPEFNG